VEFTLVAGSLTLVDLDVGETLHRAGDRFEYVYFVETGFISAMSVLADGAPVEIGLIGVEGLDGVSVILGADTSFSETICQTGGRAYRIPAATLKKLAVNAPFLRNLLLRYICFFGEQVAQTAACNSHHDLYQRLARWLLAALDRSETPELTLTQDLIAVMLGVRRATVSVAAAALQRAGFIRYMHGRITVLDRPGLEAASCECYATIVAEYRHLLVETSLPVSVIKRSGIDP
jgi:CRP-like cAMP-binding protein